MSSLTGANAVIQLAITGLFPVPQRLQGFTVDDVFDAEAIVPTEIMTGVDGNLSAGYVYVPRKQGITLQGDSASNLLFEAWFAAQEAVQEAYFANGIVHLTAVGRHYVMTRGVLTSFPPMPTVKKLIQPRKYEITWGKVVAAPV